MAAPRTIMADAVRTLLRWAPFFYQNGFKIANTIAWFLVARSWYERRRLQTERSLYSHAQTDADAFIAATLAYIRRLRSHVIRLFDKSARSTRDFQELRLCQEQTLSDARQLNGDLIEARSALTDASGIIVSVDAQRAEAVKERDEARKEVELLRQEHVLVQGECQRLGERLIQAEQVMTQPMGAVVDQLEQQLARVNIDYAQSRAELDDARDELEEAREELADCQEQIAAESARAQALQDRIDSLSVENAHLRMLGGGDGGDDAENRGHDENTQQRQHQPAPAVPEKRSSTMTTMTKKRPAAAGNDRARAWQSPLRHIEM